MTLDIKGAKKNRTIKNSPYAALDELLYNSIDAFLIRKNRDEVPDDNLKITFTIIAHHDLASPDDPFNISLKCQDNGCGIGEAEQESFLTQYTTYKDDLKITGLQQCRGSGRLQYFYFFSTVEIESIYQQGKEYFNVKLKAGSNKNKIESQDFKKMPSDVHTIGTTITLHEFQDNVLKSITNKTSLKTLFSLDNIRKHILSTHLRRFIVLDKEIGQFKIDLIHQNLDGTNKSTQTITNTDIPHTTQEKEITINGQEPYTGEIIKDEKYPFKISYYNIPHDSSLKTENMIALCANNSVIKHIDKDILRGNQIKDTQHAHLFFIESAYLDQFVNQERDNFANIPNKIPDGKLNLSTGHISYEMISDELTPIIYDILPLEKWDKELVLKELKEQFAITEKTTQELKVKIIKGDTSSSIATRVFNRDRERTQENLKETISYRKELKTLDPTADDCNEKINRLSQKALSTIKQENLLNLAQTIHKRNFCIELLQLSYKKELYCQKSASKRRKDEAIIHNIFFPMKSDSVETKEHNLWILDEEYHYFDYITSDKQLKHLERYDSDSNINESLKEIYKQYNDKTQNCRLDIALFKDEGAAVIIEFKAPNVAMDEHQHDLTRYARALVTKSQGKIKRIYTYIIGDKLNEENLMEGWTPFSTAKGFFRSDKISLPREGIALGDHYIEILFYDDIINRATKRMKIYTEKIAEE